MKEYEVRNLHLAGECGGNYTNVWTFITLLLWLNEIGCFMDKYEIFVREYFDCK